MGVTFVERFPVQLEDQIFQVLQEAAWRTSSSALLGNSSIESRGLIHTRSIPFAFFFRRQVNEIKSTNIVLTC
jgi:hypothetical protein